MTTLLIEVYPNSMCEIKLEEQYRVMNCTEGEFCSFAILWDHVFEKDDDYLYYHSNIPLNHVWLRFSSLNKTIFGVPNIVADLNATILIYDQYGGTCEMSFKIYVEPKTPQYAHIIAILLLVVLILIALGISVYAMLVGT